MGVDGRWPASGGGVCGSGKTKGRQGIALLPHEEVLAGEKAVGEAATAKIDTSGRISKTAAVGSVGGARDPADLNKSTSEPPMRSRSEEEGLESFTDDEGARAAAMGRRLALRSVTQACEGKGRCGSLGVCEGGSEVPWGCLYRPERGGEGAPGGHGHQGHAALMGNHEGGFKERKRPSDGGRVKRSFTAT
jgi:hypothetical protein